MTKCPGDAEWLRLTGSNYYIRHFVQQTPQGTQWGGNKYNTTEVMYCNKQLSDGSCCRGGGNKNGGKWPVTWLFVEKRVKVDMNAGIFQELYSGSLPCTEIFSSCYTRTVRAFNAFNQCDERGVLTHCSAVISTGGVQTVQDLFWWHARCMLRVVQCPSDRYLCTAEANKCSQNMRRAPCSSDTKMQPCLSCRVGWIRFSNGWICLWWKQLCLCGQT